MIEHRALAAEHAADHLEIIAIGVPDEVHRVEVAILEIHAVHLVALGAVKVTVLPALMSPVSKALDPVAVTVWATVSSFVTVTLVPGATVRLAGSKAKFLITIVFAAAAPADAPAGALLAGVPLELEEHPASRRVVLTDTAATAARRRMVYRVRSG